MTMMTMARRMNPPNEENIIMAHVEPQASPVYSFLTLINSSLSPLSLVSSFAASSFWRYLL